MNADNFSLTPKPVLSADNFCSRASKAQQAPATQRAVTHREADSEKLARRLIIGFGIIRCVAAPALIAVILGSTQWSAPAADATDPQPQIAAAVNFEYFPGQYVNQATSYEDHIQAF